MYAAPSSAPRTLAIVGAGGATTALLHSLAEKAEDGAPVPRNILIFEPSRTPGPGAVYRDDLASARINREAGQMSVSSADPEHFGRWRAGEGKGPGPGAEDPRHAHDQFPGRPTFGRYLADQFAISVRQLRLLGVDVSVIQDEVVNLLPTQPVRLVTRARKTWVADELVLAMGSPPQPDIYHLEGSPHYFRDPFPLCRLVQQIPVDASVAVLGTGLTAVDIAVALARSGHRRPPHLLSRTGMLPRVRAGLPTAPLTHFTTDNLNQLADRKGGLTLEDLTELLQRDAGHRLPPLARALELARFTGGAAPALRRQLAGQEPDIARWQQLLAATNPAVECAWRLLRASEQRRLFERYHRPLTNLRNPMPRVNAQFLLDLMDAGKLIVSGGLQHVGAYADGTFYAVLAQGPDESLSAEDYLFDEGGPGIREYDVVISAVGPDPGVAGLRAMPLTASLINQGLARAHPYGGLAVTEDHALIDADGTPDPRIRVIGNLTAGTFYYTSSMEMVARQAARTALLLPGRADAERAGQLKVAVA